MRARTSGARCIGTFVWSTDGARRTRRICVRPQPDAQAFPSTEAVAAVRPSRTITPWATSAGLGSKIGLAFGSLIPPAMTAAELIESATSPLRSITRSFAPSRGAFVGGRASDANGSFGPAMRFVLLLARLRSRPATGTGHGPSVDGGRHGAAALARCEDEIRGLWDLAERYHPEQTWLAESWVRGQRTLAEVSSSAPRERLAAPLWAAAMRSPLAAALSV